MEVDGSANQPSKAAASGSSSVLAPTGTNTSVTVALHPLVIMNVSDHWTRIRAQNNNEPQQVIGALLGKQTGRHVELTNSFELPFVVVNSAAVIDVEFYHSRENQYVEVFPELSVVGWYTSAASTSEPTQADVAVHTQMSQLIDSPLFLKLNPTPPATNTDKLPLATYESIIDVVDNEPRVQFVHLAHSLATEQAERIGVDHIARVSNAHSEQASVSKQLYAMHGAIKMLHQRLLLVAEYLAAVQSGELERNEQLLREATALCQRLPLADAHQFDHQYINMNSDMELVSLLGCLTKTAGTMNQLVGKLNVFSDRHAPLGVRRTRGTPFHVMSHFH